MKILIVTESPEVWGAEHSLLTLLRDLPEWAKITVLTGIDSPLAPLLSDVDVSVIEDEAFARKKPFSQKGLGFAADLLGVAKQFVRARRVLEDFDLVLIFNSWSVPAFSSASKVLRKKIVIDLHETFSVGLRTKLLSHFLRLADRVIVPAMAVLDQNQWAVDAGRLRVVPRPIDSIFFNNTPPDSIPRRFAHRAAIIGQITPHKKVAELIESVNWAETDTELIVVGGEPNSSERSDYELSVRDLVRIHEDDRVRIIDRTSEVAGILSSSDFVVNVSEHEAFGRTVAEGIASGAFPLVLHGRGPAEIVDAVGWGAILDDLSAIPAAIRMAVCEDQLSSITVSAARARAQVLFGVEHASKNYWSVLEEIR